MRLILLFLIFVCFGFSKTVIIDKSLEELTLSSNMQYLKVDLNSSNTPDEILNSTKLQPIVNPNFGQNFSASIWSISNIQNHDSQIKRVYFLNPMILIEYADIYVYENSKQIQHFVLGISRFETNQNIFSRFIAFYVDMKPNATYTIISKFTNSRARIDVEWIAMSQDYFEHFLLKDFFIWGVILGCIFIIFILHFLFYLTLQNKSFLSYLIYIFLFWLYIFVNNGFLAYFVSHGEYNIILAHISGYSMLVYYIIFLDEYLGLSKKNQYRYLLIAIYSYTTYLAMTSWIIAFSTIIYSLDDYYFVITGLILLIMFIVTTKEVILNSSIFGFYLFGQLFLLLGFLFLFLNSFQIIPTKTYNQQLIGIFGLIEMIFFAMAVLVKIKQSIKLKEQNDRLILSQSHFSTIGQTLRNIAHQWKVPTVRLGTLITELEATFYKMKISNPRVDEIFDNMRSSTSFMKNTISEFSNFYSSDGESSKFSINTQIDEIKMLLLEKMNFLNFNIIVDESLEKIFVLTNPRTLGHICMIIIDNAIEIAQQRHIQNPNIKIYALENEHNIEIIFEDNCNGIYQKPIKLIFELEVSSHNDKNRGSGLAIAKMLVESKMGGSIEVENIENGAQFKLKLPKNI